MTVIVLARATNGLVVAADGRTCIQDPVESPPKVLDNKARKVQVHRVGDSGWVTASSGRATFRKDTTVADVLDQFWSEHTTPDEEMPNFKRIAETLQAAIRQVNLDLECNCRTRTRCNLVSCSKCDFDLEPGQEFVPQADCPRCHGEWKFEMICECAPDEALLSSSSDAPTWCRCKAIAEPSLKVLGVPFGPQYPNGYGEPETAVVPSDHEQDIDYSYEQKSIVMHGELEDSWGYFFDTEVTSATNQMVNKFIHKGKVDLAATKERVLDLLRTAREEGESRAVLRALRSEDGQVPTQYTPTSLGFEPWLDYVSAEELAAAVRAFEQKQGHDIDEQVGVPGIGGVFTWVTIDESGTVTDPKEIPSLRVACSRVSPDRKASSGGGRNTLER